MLLCGPASGLVLGDLHYLVTTPLGLALLPGWLSEVTIYRERNAVAGDMQGSLIQDAEGRSIPSNHLCEERISHVLGILENTMKAEPVGLQLSSMWQCPRCLCKGTPPGDWQQPGYGLGKYSLPKKGCRPKAVQAGTHQYLLDGTCICGFCTT